jgi:hypothetical protein
MFRGIDREMRGAQRLARRPTAPRPILPPAPGGRVYQQMGYIVALVLLLIAVPLIFILSGRRTTSAGGMAARPRDRGVTVSQPSSDQPTPRGDATVNQTAPGAERRLPPG